MDLRKLLTVIFVVAAAVGCSSSTETSPDDDVSTSSPPVDQASAPSTAPLDEASTTSTTSMDTSAPLTVEPEEPTLSGPSWNVEVVSGSAGSHGGVTAQVPVVTASGDAYALLVGWVADDPTHEDRRPALWAARSGGVELITDSAFGERDVWVSDVASVGSRLIAVGYRIENGVRRGSIWEADAEDPTQWSQVYEPDFEGTFVAAGVSWDRVIVIGSTDGERDRRPVVIIGSSSGWSDPEPLEAPDGNVRLAGIAVAGNGRVLVAGGVTADGVSQPIVWRSQSSGLRWTTEMLPAEDDVTSIEFVAPDGSGFVMTGADSQDPLLWRSDETGEWRRSRLGRDDIRAVSVSSSVERGDRIVLAARVTDARGGVSPLLLYVDRDDTVETYGLGPIDQIKLGEPGPLVFDHPDGDSKLWMAQPVIGSFVVRTGSSDPAIAEPGDVLPVGGPFDMTRGINESPDAGLAVVMTSLVDFGERVFGPESRTVVSDGGSWQTASVLSEQRLVGVLEVVADGSESLAIAAALPLASDRATDLNDIAVATLDATGQVSDVSFIDGIGDQSPTAFAVDATGTWWLAGSERQRIAGSELQGRIWTSTDGASWERVAGPYEVDRAEVTDLCPTDDGLLAVGSFETETGLRAPTAWRYSGTWEEIGIAHAGATARISGCSDGDRGLLVGAVDGEATVWQLSPAHDSDAEFQIIQQFDDLTAITDLIESESGVAIVGPTRSFSASRNALVVSSDLVTWEMQNMPGSTLVHQVVVGMSAAGDDIRLWGQQGRSAVVWTVSDLWSASR